MYSIAFGLSQLHGEYGDGKIASLSVVISLVLAMSFAVFYTPLLGAGFDGSMIELRVKQGHQGLA